MRLNIKRVKEIVGRRGSGFPYVTAELALKIIGSVMSTRNKRVKPMTDVERVLRGSDVPLHHRAGYRTVAAEYFNQSKKIDRRGKYICMPR